MLCKIMLDFHDGFNSPSHYGFPMLSPLHDKETFCVLEEVSLDCSPFTSMNPIWIQYYDYLCCWTLLTQQVMPEDWHCWMMVGPSFPGHCSTGAGKIRPPDCIQTGRQFHLAHRHPPTNYTPVQTTYLAPTLMHTRAQPSQYTASRQGSCYHCCNHLGTCLTSPASCSLWASDGEAVGMEGRRG